MARVLDITPALLGGKAFSFFMSHPLPDEEMAILWRRQGNSLAMAPVSQSF